MKNTPRLELPRRFVTPVWMRLFCGLAAFATPVAAWNLYAERGLSWLTLVSMAVALFALLGLLDALTARVELHPEYLVVVANLRRHKYQRSNLVRVNYGKGTDAAVQHVDGHWIPLPAVAPGNQGLCNSLRAWLKRSEHDRQAP